jgi:hypothetical protein
MRKINKFFFNAPTQLFSIVLYNMTQRERKWFKKREPSGSLLVVDYF